MSEEGLPEHPLPLYLGAKARVVLDAGPSLVVHAEGRVPLRVPLGYCARIVMHASARIATDALLACVRHRIPVLWLNEDGRAQAVCVPVAPDAMQWGDLLRQAWAHEAWDTRYANWYRAQQWLAMRSLARRYRGPEPQSDVDAWLQKLFARHRLRQAWNFWALRQWQGMLVAIVHRYWLDHGYSVEAFHCRLRGWDFAAELAALLRLELCASLIGRAAYWREVRAKPLTEVRLALMRELETRLPRIAQLLDALHRRFFRWLLSWEDWR